MTQEYKEPSDGALVDEEQPLPETPEPVVEAAPEAPLTRAEMQAALAEQETRTQARIQEERRHFQSVADRDVATAKAEARQAAQALSRLQAEYGAIQEEFLTDLDQNDPARAAQVRGKLKVAQLEAELAAAKAAPVTTAAPPPQITPEEEAQARELAEQVEVLFQHYNLPKDDPALFAEINPNDPALVALYKRSLAAGNTEFLRRVTAAGERRKALANGAPASVAPAPAPEPAPAARPPANLNTNGSGPASGTRFRYKEEVEAALANDEISTGQARALWDLPRRPR